MAAKLYQHAEKYLKNTLIIRGIDGIEPVDMVLKYCDQLSIKMIPS